MDSTIHGVSLYLDGILQLCSRDERRYHAALVLPLLAVLRPGPRILIIGGGDGCAARDILARDVSAAVTIVDHEPMLLNLASTHPALVALNRGAFLDRRVTVTCADAFDAMTGITSGSFDGIIFDLVDLNHPGFDGRKFAFMMARAVRIIADEGGIATHAGSPFIHSGWRDIAAEFVTATADMQRIAYLVEVPSFGPWSFLAAGKRVPRIEEIQPPPITLSW